LLCRIFSLGILGTAIGYFLLSLDSFNSLEEEVTVGSSRLKDIKLATGEESNASEANMVALFKINRELRKDLESLNEESDGAEEELNFLVPKIQKLKAELELALQELEKEKSNLIDFTNRLSGEEAKLLPLIKQKEGMMSELGLVGEEHQKIEQEWNRLDQNFSSLSRVRQAALDSYSDAKKSLVEEIVRPFDIFYGDSLRVEIENVAPNGRGFFSKTGERDGMQQGFVFIVRTGGQWSEMPYYVRCTLVEKTYSFLEIIDQETQKNIPSIQAGEKLTLIRTAELSNPIDSPDFSEEKSLSHHDL
jgi:hypothetical protein